MQFLAGVLQVRKGLGADDPVRTREVLDRLTARPSQRGSALFELNLPISTREAADGVVVPGVRWGAARPCGTLLRFPHDYIRVDRKWVAGADVPQGGA
jgi:hypothetical protein